MKAYDQASGTLKVLSTSEKGINALLAGNGVIEASTGRDMFGKPLTEEQRKNSLLQGIMMMNAFSRGKFVSHETKIAVGEQAKAFKADVNTLIQQTKENVKLRKLKPSIAGASDELSQLTDDVGDVAKTHALAKADHVGGISEKSAIEGEKLHAAKGSGKGSIQLGKEDLDALRKKWNVPETNTIAVGKTDVKGLESLIFEGGSPEVRKEAGLPSIDTILPNREIRAPYDHIKNPKLAQFTRHAEEGILNEFDSNVKKSGIKPIEITGTLRVHQSNPRGVCNKCSKGLLNPCPIEKSGIFYQASKKYPNLTIEVTSEIDDSVKTNGLLFFVLKDGRIIK